MLGLGRIMDWMTSSEQILLVLFLPTLALVRGYLDSMGCSGPYDPRTGGSGPKGCIRPDPNLSGLTGTSGGEHRRYVRVDIRSAGP